MQQRPSALQTLRAEKIGNGKAVRPGDSSHLFMSHKRAAHHYGQIPLKAG
jgi:hypothetical protein